MAITDTTREEARALARRYPVARAALLPILHLVQSADGYVSDDGISLAAEVLGLTRAEVGAVATFYTMYKREPVGDYLLSVCTNPTCKIAGGQAIYEAYVEACGGRHVDPDGAGVMVEHAECLGICDAAPVVQINYEMYGPVTHDEAMGLLSAAKAGEPPVSNRSGHVPAVFAAVEREFSGIDDGVHEQLVEAARLQAAAAVPPAYRTGETDLPVTHPGGDPSGHGGAAFQAAFDTPPGLPASPQEVEDVVEDAVEDVVEEVVEELAATGTDTAQELAQQVAGDNAATPEAVLPAAGQPSAIPSSEPDETSSEPDETIEEA